MSDAGSKNACRVLTDSFREAVRFAVGNAMYRVVDDAAHLTAHRGMHLPTDRVIDDTLRRALETAMGREILTWFEEAP